MMDCKFEQQNKNNRIFLDSKLHQVGKERLFGIFCYRGTYLDSVNNQVDIECSRIHSYKCFDSNSCYTGRVQHSLDIYKNMKIYPKFAEAGMVQLECTHINSLLYSKSSQLDNFLKCNHMSKLKSSMFEGLSILFDLCISMNKFMCSNIYLLSKVEFEACTHKNSYPPPKSQDFCNLMFYCKHKSMFLLSRSGHYCIWFSIRSSIYKCQSSRFEDLRNLQYLRICIYNFIDPNTGLDYKLELCIGMNILQNSKNLDYHIIQFKGKNISSFQDSKFVGLSITLRRYICNRRLTYRKIVFKGIILVCKLVCMSKLDLADILRHSMFDCIGKSMSSY